VLGRNYKGEEEWDLKTGPTVAQFAQTESDSTLLSGLMPSWHLTIRYPLWPLLYFGWELEYGWKGSDEQKEQEAASTMSLAFSRALYVATATQVAT
jgi:hypothetical protein